MGLIRWIMRLLCLGGQAPEEDEGWMPWRSGAPAWPDKDTMVEVLVESRAEMGRRRRYIRNGFYTTGYWVTDSGHRIESDSVVGWRYIVEDE